LLVNWCLRVKNITKKVQAKNVVLQYNFIYISLYAAYRINAALLPRVAPNKVEYAKKRGV